MASIFDSIKGLITPELISQAASSLGEDKSSVTKAVVSAVPSILGSLLAKGNDPKVESALKEAGNANDGILSNIGSLFGGSSDSATQNIGSNLLSSILGSKLGGLSSLISGISGLSSGSTSGLLSMLTPLIGGFLGKKMNSDGGGLSGLLSLLGKEKDSFLGLIPSGLGSLLGVSSFANLGKQVSSVTDAVSGVVKKTSLGWLKWLLPLVLGLGLLFFLWKSCGSSVDKAKDKVETAVNTTVATASTAADAVVAKARELTQLTLPDGLKISAYKGGLEDQILTFLGSDEYKKADSELLKGKWFNFDNINFEFGSSTQLTAESNQQIDNLVAIIKYHKSAKIKIGAYTDKKGEASANLKLSQERANTIRKILASKGISTQVTGAEGYGDQFATISADASDEARAVDRRVAIRFDK